MIHIKKHRYKLLIFIVCFIVYFCIGSFLALNTMIIDNRVIPANLYFEFDGPRMLNETLALNSSGFYVIKHPLMKLILSPAIVIGWELENLIGFKARTLFFVLLTSSITALASVFVYKYLDLVIEEKKVYRTLLLTLLFSFFSTSLVVSFTVDSYPFSLFMLVLVTYYYSYIIKHKKSLSSVKAIILATLTTGFTLTNSIKCVTPILFLNIKFSDRIKSFFKIVAITSGIFLAYFLSLFTIKSLFQTKAPVNLLTIAIDDFIYFSQSTGIEKFDFFHAVSSLFFGSPLFFSPLNIKHLWYEGAPSFLGMWLKPYDTWHQYLVLFVIAGLIVTAFIKNWRNPIVQFIAINFSFDLLLHVIFKWGLYESFIYGSHWVFIVPIFIGWLYRSLSAQYGKFLDGVLVIVFLYIVVNNFYNIFELISFALKYYPV